MTSEKIRNFLKSFLIDTFQPVVFPFVIGVIFAILIPVIAIIARPFLALWASGMFFFFGLRGFQSVRRKEAFTKYGHRYTGQAAVINGWCTMIIFWSLSLFLLILASITLKLPAFFGL